MFLVIYRCRKNLRSSARPFSVRSTLIVPSHSAYFLSFIVKWLRLMLLASASTPLKCTCILHFDLRHYFWNFHQEKWRFGSVSYTIHDISLPPLPRKFYSTVWVDKKQVWWSKWYSEVSHVVYSFSSFFFHTKVEKKQLGILGEEHSQIFQTGLESRFKRILSQKLEVIFLVNLLFIISLRMPKTLNI